MGFALLKHLLGPRHDPLAFPSQVSSWEPKTEEMEVEVSEQTPLLQTNEDSGVLPASAFFCHLSDP